MGDRSSSIVSVAPPRLFCTKESVCKNVPKALILIKKRIVAKSVTLRAKSVTLPEETSIVHLATKDMFYSGECACLGYAALDTIKMQMIKSARNATILA